MFNDDYDVKQDANGIAFRQVSLKGRDLLNDPFLNKGTAFSDQERTDFELVGLLPPQVQQFEDQLERTYAAFKHSSSDMDKYLNLRALQDRNETLFYALLSRHIEEMIPIIYTPTVGKACQQFSHRYQRPRGLYITPDNVGDMAQLAKHVRGEQIKIIVVTDSQGILGIGDQGVGGMGIPIGKLSLYTLGAGINPAACLPIALDIGTDNQALLDDPMYLGRRHPRIRGAAYDQFIAQFVAGVQAHFPAAVLQWEDFSKANAFNNLERYQQALPSFNDDIQGTGAVVLAGILNAAKIKGETLADQTFLVYGAGAGGVGVADQICNGLIHDGLTPEAARAKIYILDTQGLVCDNRSGLDEYKKRYAKPAHLLADWGTKTPGQADLTEVLTHVPVTVLVGTSGVGGAFTENHIQLLLKHSTRPLVFPLSNPTANCEALPEDIYRWSKGQALVATGSPFADVVFNGTAHRIGQGNNVFIFPGVGLAAIVGRSQVITAEMFTHAALALADCVDEQDLALGTLFPRMSQLRQISLQVAEAVLTGILAADSSHPLHQQDVHQVLAAQMWDPRYVEYRRV